uniref:Putative secreted peptide n=1 Tax=Anopheles braziliensis TaxID=58242 RepID=A0A2M3ZNC7_9DIPT
MGYHLSVLLLLRLRETYASKPHQTLWCGRLRAKKDYENGFTLGCDSERKGGRSIHIMMYTVSPSRSACNLHTTGTNANPTRIRSRHHRSPAPLLLRSVPSLITLVLNLTDLMGKKYPQHLRK